MRHAALLAMLMALPVWAEKLEIRLGHEIGQPAGVVLRGPNPGQSVLFTLPRGRAIQSAHLALRLRYSSGLIAGSNFTAAVNGTPVGSIRLDIHLNGSGEADLSAAIPVEALRDYNRLEFQAALRDSANQCENPSDPALWATVAASSSMVFEIGDYLRAPNVEDFPVPLADPLDYRPAAVRFVLTPQHPSSDYALAARIAGALGDRLEYRTAQITAAPQFDPAADAGQVLLGTPESLAALTGVAGPALAAGEGRIRVIENVRRPGRYLLLVEGRDAMARRQAAESLTEAARPRGLLPVDESFKLSEIAPLVSEDSSGGVTVHGADPAAIVISLRPAAGEHFVRAEQTVHLEYAYSPQVDNASSTLEVRLNGKTLLGQALARPAGSAAEVLEVSLPAEMLGEENRLELRFHLYPKNGGACTASGSSGSDSGQLWATLLGSSGFHLPRDSYADLPDLAALRRGGFPFRDGPTMWVAKPADATLLLNAAFLLGRLSGTAPPAASLELRFESEITTDVRRDYHLITVAAGPAIAIEEAISPWNPQRVILTVTAPEENAIALQEPAFIAGLAGAVTRMDAAKRVRSVRAARTARFGVIPINRRVKYWVMDNVLWLIANSLALLFAGFFFLRYLRKHHFQPLPE